MVKTVFYLVFGVSFYIASLQEGFILASQFWFITARKVPWWQELYSHPGGTGSKGCRPDSKASET